MDSSIGFGYGVGGGEEGGGFLTQFEMQFVLFFRSRYLGALKIPDDALEHFCSDGGLEYSLVAVVLGIAQERAERKHAQGGSLHMV